jgi:sulfite dehydrogenase (quinone) subunit SoeB
VVAARGGYDLMAELGYLPTNKYLPPRPRQSAPGCTGAPQALEPAEPQGGFLAWLDRVLGD